MSKKIKNIRPVYRENVINNVRVINNVHIHVIASDSLSTAIDELCNGMSVLVLNFANNISPGGGYGNRGHTQEEYLIRGTNLLDSLEKVGIDKLYPICATPNDAAAILSRDIKITKPLAEDMSCMISIITCPALAGPRVRNNLEDIDISYFMYDEDRKNTEKRIDLICAAAARIGVDVLIAGAWGCGVFCNPVYELCLLWKKYIALYNIPKVVFPIPVSVHGEGNDYLYRMFHKFLQ